MDEEFETPTARLSAIDRATLTPLVRIALNRETVEVMAWDYEQLHGGAGSGNAIYRFTGQGRDRGQEMSWSLILKTAYPEGDNTQLSAWNYYKREADAYQSGWLQNLPGGLAAPRCFGVAEHPDGACWIWLEDVADDIGSHWPLEHYGVVARHAGQLNGAYLVERSLPSWPWLSSGWLRHNTESCAPALPLLRDSLDHPVVRRWLPGEAGDSFFRLWAERGVYFDAIDRLPQTLCHLDLFRRNLFARRTADSGYESVAIDWAFAGRGAVGEEIVSLVLANFILFEVGLDKAQALEEIVFEGYLEGLRDVGWRGDPRQVRLGYAAAASLRYRFNETGRWLAVILDESLQAIFLDTVGRPVGEVLDQVAQVGRLSDRLADEARELIDALT
jgi:hypothetical protein